MNMTKRDLKGLWIILIGTLLIGSAGGYILIKTGLLEKFVIMARNNIILSMLLLLPLILSMLTNMIYGMSISPLPVILNGIVYNRVLGMFVIYNGRKISDSYYASENTGVIGEAPFYLDILMTLFYVFGMIYLFVKEGFFIFTPTTVVWASILYGIFFVNVCTKSFIMGKVAASFDDIVYNKRVSKYYITPLVLCAGVLLYYLYAPVMIIIGKPEAIMIKSTLINILTLLIPFLLPVYTTIVVRGIVNQVVAFYNTYKN